MRSMGVVITRVWSLLGCGSCKGVVATRVW